MMEKIKNYIAPNIEIIEIEVEKGFAQSSPAGDAISVYNDGGSAF